MDSSTECHYATHTRVAHIFIQLHTRNSDTLYIIIVTSSPNVQYARDSSETDTRDGYTSRERRSRRRDNTTTGTVYGVDAKRVRKRWRAGARAYFSRRRDDHERSVNARGRRRRRATSARARDENNKIGKNQRAVKYT